MVLCVKSIKVNYNKGVPFHTVFAIQEQVKAAAAAQAASEGEADGELSPLPLPGGQPPRRRGAISAEPVTEEDATSYVKKVTNQHKIYNL